LELKSAISVNVCKSGLEVLVHNLETVTGSLPNCSACHLLVCPVSANTAFILFNFNRSDFVSIIDLLNSDTKLLVRSDKTAKSVMKHIGKQTMQRMVGEIICGQKQSDF